MGALIRFCVNKMLVIFNTCQEVTAIQLNFKINVKLHDAAMLLKGNVTVLVPARLTIQYEGPQ